ncbi:MAG: hypothetical protein V3G42_00835 [Oscillospiraceae bacterium]
MSTREIAYRMIDGLDEERLKALILLLGGQIEEIQQTEKQKAFETLEQLRRPLLHLDYEKELEEYREEKYGV